MGSRTGSKLKSWFILLMIPVGFMLITNLFWLRYSTTRVSTDGPGMADVQIRMNEQVVPLGDMRKNISRFMFLPESEGAVFSVTHVEDGSTKSVCEVQVRSAGDHVEVSLRKGRISVCTVTDALFSELMVTKFF